MSTNPMTIDAPATAAERMRATMTAVRVSIQWFGVRKTLTPEQRAQAAESFGAAGQFISAGKKLLDTSHPAYKAVTAVRGQILGYWKGMTLPFPEPGIRLIRQDQIEAFNARMNELREDLAAALDQLDRQYRALKAAAQERLGQLYNETDYPEVLRGMFGVEWDFPSVEPPQSLRQLAPEIWQQECTRVSTRFDDAVQMAEQAFMEELGSLVGHITERLSGNSPDGKPKIFRDSAVISLREFFDRFRSLNVRSNEQLDQLVEQAQQAVSGIAPQDLRDNGALRQRIAAQMTTVGEALDQMQVDRPRRRILRRPLTGEVA